ncbi:MAG: hypothetical protein ACTH2Q_01430, partial [Propionibacteriaceae bacterium]
KTSRSGATVLLTSHNLVDIERMADRVLMLRSGRLTQDLTLSEFKALAGYEAVVTAMIKDGEGATEWTRFLPSVNMDSLRQVITELADRDVLQLTVRPSSLDEAYAEANQEPESP